MSFVTIAEDKRYLLNQQQRPFFVLGANYEGYFDRAWRMWDDSEFDASLLRFDFGKMKETGLNTVRLFLLPALENDVRAGKFHKLDTALQIAAEHGLQVLFTFNDAHSLQLARVADMDAKIAARYKDDPVILGWDLENEPVFYNFVAAIYPESNPAPAQTPALIDHYGARVSQADALELQRQHRIPAHLNPQQAFYYINALRLFIEFNDAAVAWAAEHGGTQVEYIYSTASADWHKFIEVMNATVAAWLNIRQTAARQADPNHLITVGYNWLQFAGLPANRALDFQEFHKYGSASFSSLKKTITALKSLRKVFPKHPIMMGEFGYSNQTSTNPAASKPVAPEKTALFEATVLAWLRANQFAGGLKWMLNDVDTTANPYEAGFGIYSVGDRPKPVRELLAQFSRRWPAPPGGGSLNLVQDRRGVAFRMDLGTQILLGGGVFQDASFSWQADSVGYCFIDHQPEFLQMTALGNGHFAVDPWEIVTGWTPRHQSVLHRVAESGLVRLASFSPQERVAWALVSGTTYRLMKGALVDDASPPDPEIAPNPGEHVVVLPDAADTLTVALPYIRLFAPDITFAPDVAAGRWLYVTVIAPPEVVSEAMLDVIRAAGARLVERIDGDVSAILETLVAQERRFISAGPDDSPVQPPPNQAGATLYTVRLGDTLSKIALMFYGKSALWRLVFEANLDILDDPGHIRPGMQLKIPPQA